MLNLDLRPRSRLQSLAAQSLASCPVLTNTPPLLLNTANHQTLNYTLLLNTAHQQTEHYTKHHTTPIITNYYTTHTQHCSTPNNKKNTLLHNAAHQKTLHYTSPYTDQHITLHYTYTTLLNTKPLITFKSFTLLTDKYYITPNITKH